MSSDPARVRKRASYAQFRDMAGFVGLDTTTPRDVLARVAGNPAVEVLEAAERRDLEATLRAAFKLWNERQSYGSATNAAYALESLELLLSDRRGAQ